MRTYAWPLVAAIALTFNACGSDGQPAADAGSDGGAGRGGNAGRGGTGGGGRGGGGAGNTGGSTAGTGGGVAGGTGGSLAGSGGSTGGATAGAGGATGGSIAGAGGATGGSIAGAGGSAGGATAGAGGATAGSGGATGGSTGGSGGSTAGASGATGGSTAGAGGATGGSTAGAAGATGGSAGGGIAGSNGGAAGGAGGGGGTVACASPSTCPGGPDTECQQKTCVNSFCGLTFTAANTPLSVQTAGDCRRNVCDGIGNVMSAIFESDTPADDGNACTDETCVNGIPSHPPEPARTACAQAGGALCNGSAAMPACVACLLAGDCPGTDSICQRRVCGNQNTCGFSFTAAGTDAEPDATGNCRKAICDGNGGVTSTANDGDLPNDGNPCTDDTCASGAPSHPARPDGVSCVAAGGGAVCFGGACVQCLNVNHCPGSDTICRQRSCQPDHTCGGTNAPLGTAAGTDAAGNCQKAVCDGNGAVTSVADDADKPVDGDACTSDVCTNGVPTNPDLPRGTICAGDGSKACDANGDCNALTFRVVRVGSGAFPLSGNAASVFVEERRADGSLVGTVSLPTTASGANRPLTMVGNSTSEGHLSLSNDGRYLVLAGYPAAPGDADPSNALASIINRVVGRIDVAGAINTTTSFTTACSSNNGRSATSTNGSEFWLAGAGSGGTGGVWYNALGATGGEVRVVSTPGDARVVAIFGNQLYATSNSGVFTNVFSIGFSTPTTAGQTATSLPGMPTSGASPHGFVLFDLLASPPGLDTLYVADAGNGAAGGGGVQKWTFDGTTWTKVATLTFSGVTGFRAVAGYAAGQTVTLMASSFETGNRLITFIDNGTGTPAGTQVAIAANNTQFRGIALSPHFAPAP
jgi:hypothetical protein